MRISVVTVCRNSVRTIERTLASVAEQTHPLVEHVVIDGGSNDGTREILEAHREQFAVLISEPDRGIYDAMNKGWRQAQGEVVGFLNADDAFADPQVLARLAQEFADPSVDAVYGDVDLSSSTGRLVRRWRSGEFSRLKYHLGWMTPHPATYMRRHLFESYGGFREDLRISADYELMLRFLYVQRARVKYLPTTLVQMTAGGASNGSLRGIARANWEVYRSWRLNALTTTPTIMLTKPLSKLLQLRL